MTRPAMEFIHIDATVRGPNGSRTLRMMVDTGSTFTWVPEGLAQELGARVIRPISIRVADSRSIERMLGELEVEIQGRKATRLVVFGHEGDMALVGADTLEGLLFEVDPVEGKLRPLSYALAV